MMDEKDLKAFGKQFPKAKSYLETLQAVKGEKYAMAVTLSTLTKLQLHQLFPKPEQFETLIEVGKIQAHLFLSLLKMAELEEQTREIVGDSERLCGFAAEDIREAEA